MERVIDTIGLICPLPVLKTAERIRETPPGGELVVLSDDPGVLFDLPAYCSAHGHEFLGSEEGPGGVYHLRIRKGRRSGAGDRREK